MKSKKPNIDAVFHALGDPTRRAIVARLSKGPLTVSELAEPLQMSLAAVVQHLQVLEKAGLIATEKTGRVRTCRISAVGLSLAEQWFGNLRAVWQRKLDRLGDLLAEENEQSSSER
jgi:DNA-binding transcriptional ArsR family regulator